MAVLDGKNRVDVSEIEGGLFVESDQLKPDLRNVERFLEELLEDKLQSLQEDLTGRIEKCFRNCNFFSSAGIAEPSEMDGANSTGRMQESELSEDMIAFAFTMGE